MKKKANYFMIVLIIIGAVLFGVISFVVIRSTRTVNAVVPAGTIASGQPIDKSMLKIIQVPVGTPSGYLQDTSSLIGQKLKINARENQLLYQSDVMLSWDEIVYGANVPNDYVVLAMQVPDERAVGGLISAGDTVDILGVVDTTEFKDRYYQTGYTTYTQTFDPTNPTAFLDGHTVQHNTYTGAGYGYGDEDEYSDIMQKYIGAVADHGYGGDGVRAYWVLANVKILETTSVVSSADNSVITQVLGDGQGEGTYYIIALCYEDYQKLILCSKYLELWMNIAPAYNNENGPMLDIMQYSEIQGLRDSQAQSILERVENEKGETHEVIRSDVLDDYAARIENYEKEQEEREKARAESSK